MNTSLAQSIGDLPEQFNAAVDLIEPNLAAGRGGKIAIIDRDTETTYAQLAARIDRMANSLRDAGIRQEQRVLLCLLDTAEFPVAFLGAIKAGIIPVPLNTLMTTRDYRWILEDSRAAAVIVSEELSDSWRPLAGAFPHVAFISAGAGPWTSLNRMLAAANAQAMPAVTHRDEPAFWLYTSGSTGRPKGAVHAHSSMRLTANLFGLGVIGYCENDVVLSVAKQFFAYGLGNALCFPYAAGSTVVLRKDRPTPKAISDLMIRHQVTVLNGVPTFFAAWLASGHAPEQHDVPKLRIATSAGEPLPTHIGTSFHDRFGIDVIDGLGSTEMLHIYVSQQPGSVRYGCTGKPVAGYQVKIVGDEGRLCGPGEIGELHAKGPTAAIGYWKNRVNSLATFLGDWVRTGDKYICDENGWYTYAGRTDDMLKVGGIYVSPTEVEEALIEHDAVLEAAVVGFADGNGLIKPRAHIVLKPGIRNDANLADALQAHVKRQLAPYKCPRWIVFEEELPKTATGKIQRYLLRGRP